MAHYTGGLKTPADKELDQFKPGIERYEDRRASQTKATDPPAVEGTAAVPWAYFQLRHPEYDADLWQEMRALYSGGPKLLRDKQLMGRLFPSHRNEDPPIYRERVARAHYFPYAGTIIDSLVSGLAADPVTVMPADEDDRDAALPGWWAEFLKDVSPRGNGEASGLVQSAQQLLLEQMRSALITGCSWTLIDIPQTPEEYVTPDSLLAQSQAGLLDPYAIAVDPEYVIDWQDDQNGELEWALVCDTEVRREGLTCTRGWVTKTFTVYTRADWTQYRITYDPAKPPRETDPVMFLRAGVHPFGKVPLLRLKLPDGLWAMGKLESLSREHFNKRNALAWAEYKSLFALLYKFLAPEEAGTEPIGAAQEDPDRGTNQIHGQGYAQILGAKDDARYIGPDVAPFSEARESCDQIMREIHRVMFSMHMSVDMSSGAMRRSEGSKEQDHQVTQVLLRAFGSLLRDLMRRIVDMVGRAREPLEPRIGGADRFSQADVAATVEQAVKVMNGVPIKSCTFKKAYLMKLYRTVLPDGLTDTEWSRVRGELDDQVSAEDMMLELAQSLEATPEPEPKTAEDDSEDDGEDDPRAAAARARQPGKPASRTGRMFSS